MRSQIWLGRTISQPACCAAEAYHTAKASPQLASEAQIRNSQRSFVARNFQHPLGVNNAGWHTGVLLASREVPTMLRGLHLRIRFHRSSLKMSHYQFIECLCHTPCAGV